MKICSFFAAAAALLLALPATSRAADAFEGVVTMALSEAAKPQGSLTYALQPPRMRTTFQPAGEKNSRRGRGDDGGAASSILNFETSEMIVLMESEKMFMRMSLASAIGATAQEAAMAETRVTRTGKTEVIAGHRAEQVILESPRTGKTEIWLAKGLGSWINPMSAGGGGMAGMLGGGGGKAEEWEKWITRERLFPLRIITFNRRSGAEETRMEATKVEKKKVPASDFLPPPDFQEFQLPSLPGFGR